MTDPTPRERPILFSGEMVRAILEGTKSQTRRIIKSPYRNHPAFALVEYGDGWQPFASDDGESHVCDDGNEYPFDCPYGAPGDLLWCRETWAQNANQLSDTHMDVSYVYRADGEQRALDNGDEKPWRPSIFMPRWASRITLRITDVRVERLQDISEYDCECEGCGHAMPRSGREHYAELWDSINGAGSWAANPWCWAISFERISAEGVEPCP